MTRLYRMLDSDPLASGCVEVYSNAHDWNQRGYGIFWTVNEFRGARRIANLERIVAWAIDMDEGTKEQMRAKLARSPLVPSLVVETKRGYQAYWGAKDGKAEHWNAIVLDRLVQFFGADKNARDLARVLRVPGYLHMKNPAEPFRCELVWQHRVLYTEMQMAQRFPAPEQEEQNKATHAAVKREVRFAGSDDFWDRVYNLDCEEGLARLSGKIGESYSFRQNANGNKNILVDGKGTSCWIDKQGRIGSLSKGGPTLYQWLRWLNYQPREAVELIKFAFPEIEERAA